MDSDANVAPAPTATAPTGTAPTQGAPARPARAPPPSRRARRRPPSPAPGGGDDIAGGGDAGEERPIRLRSHGTRVETAAVAAAPPDVPIPEWYFDELRNERVTKGKRIVATLRTVAIACCMLLPLLIVGLYDDVDIAGLPSAILRADPKVHTAHATPPRPEAPILACVLHGRRRPSIADVAAAAASLIDHHQHCHHRRRRCANRSLSQAFVLDNLMVVISGAGTLMSILVASRMCWLHSHSKVGYYLYFRFCDHL